MKTARTLILSVGALLCLAPLAARADHQTIQGRTGLPAVFDGKENVWIDRGNVQMNVVGSYLYVTQDFHLSYPKPPLETGDQAIKVGVREDYYRGREKGDPEVTTGEAKGFTHFAVYVDGRRVNASVEPWEVNDKKDTVTRWRMWNMNFRPGQTHTMRIVSRAPLGWQDNKPWVNFVSKDLGHWRDKPAFLEIKLNAPGATEARLAGVEPNPDNINPNGLRWVYRKADPDRDIFVMLPARYRDRTSSR